MSAEAPSAKEQLDRGREHVGQAARSIEHAIGALEMAANAGAQDLLGGYSGASAARYLRDAQRLVSKAKAVLDVLEARS